MSDRKTERYLLTTVDNPYNPFTQWDEWLGFDTLHNYDCCGLLARFAIVPDSFSDEDKAEEIENAIDRICNSEINCCNIYKKISENEVPKLVNV